MAGKRKRAYKSRPNKRLRRTYKSGKRRMLSLRAGGWTNPSSMITPEKKYLDVAFTALRAGNDLANDSSLTLLNGCAQGTEVTQRVGRKIHIKSLLLRLFLEANESDTTGPAGGRSIHSQYRVMLVQDLQSNNALPNGNDILQQTPISGAGTATVCNAVQNLNNRERFRILMDKTGAFFPITGTTAVHIAKFKRLNIEVQYSGSGTGNTITTNAIYLMVLSDSGNGVTAANYIMNGYARIRFIDV